MKTLYFTKERNYYHTKKEYDLTSDGTILSGKCDITGFTKIDIEVGDEFDIDGQKYVISEIKERRNHAWEFLNPEDKEGTFFNVQTTFNKLIN